MRVTMITIGSRGDVQPYVALGIGLQRAGYDVVLATHPRFESFVRDRGLHFAPVAEGVFTREAETNRHEKGEAPRRLLPWWALCLRDARSVAKQRLADCRDACDGADAILVSNFATLLGYHLAERMGLPLVRAYYTPAESVLGQDPMSGAARNGLRSGVARARDSLVREAIWLSARPWVNAARREVLGLGPLPLRHSFTTFDPSRVPLLYGYSPSVFVPPDQGPGVDVTGYWFLDRPTSWEPPAALVEFLEAGVPPVYVGFGFAPFRDREATAAIVVEALIRAGQRGILFESSLPVRRADLPPEIFVTDSIWHDWLFPRVAAAVHHGGAGTTAAALRAGIPSVVMPEFADQRFWARRMNDLGVGPPAFPRRKLSAEHLADVIRRVTTDSRMRERAATLAERIRAEDGVTRAVEAFGAYVGVGGRRA